MGVTDLPKILEDDFEVGYGTDYLGFHLVKNGDGIYHVQMDGHIGQIEMIDIDEYDTALELVDELNRIDALRAEHMYMGNDDDIIDFAGKIMTEDKERAEEEPERYTYVPPVEELPDELVIE